MDNILRKVRQELMDASDEKTRELRNDDFSKKGGRPLRGRVKGIETDCEG